MLGVPTNGKADYRPPYLLIVDDDEDFATSLSIALEQEGWIVKTAENGKVGLERIHDQRPLMVLLDLQMPVMNGRQMLKLMRQDADLDGLPVLILSAFGYEWEAELMGAQGFIPKPFDPARLEQSIKRLLGPRAVV